MKSHSFLFGIFIIQTGKSSPQGTKQKKCDMIKQKKKIKLVQFFIMNAVGQSG